MTPERLLVCGARDWSDGPAIWSLLDAWLADHADDDVRPVLIHGGARGADEQAEMWALFFGVECLRFPADWTRFGKKAGPIRNQQMLDEGQPTRVLAFKRGFGRGGGTEDMVRRARRAGVPVTVIDPVAAEASS